jgi:hypothetical protein
MCNIPFGKVRKMKRTNTALATCFVLLFAATAFATDRTWDNEAMDVYWASDTNWSGDQVPGCGDTALITGTPATGPTLSTNEACSGLTMSGTSTLDTNGYTLSIDGTFTVSDSANVTIGGSNGTIEADVINFATNAAYSISGVTITETDASCS